MQRILVANMLVLTLLPFAANANAEQCTYRFAEVDQPPNGEYTGECRNGKAQGNGKVSYDDGKSSSEGEYRNGQRHGWSTTVWANGDTYEGGYRNGKQHGKGVFVWANGNRYEGEYRDGALSGRGAFAWAGGERYVGNFSNNAMNGQGTHYSREGDRQTGYWKDGLLWNGWVYGANGSACEVRAHQSVEKGCVEFD